MTVSDTFRKFKRHYHTTKRAYFEAAENSSLGFSISHKQDEPVKYTENSPDKDKTARFAALVYRFLDERSDLYYRKILDLIKSDFPNITTTEDFEAIETGIASIESGEMPIKYNEKDFTAKQIFKLVAEAGYFERNDEAEKLFAEIAQVPFAQNLFWFQFKNYAFNAFRIISVIFDLIRAVENHDEYKSSFEPEELVLKKCIYCLSETGTFNSEEHILPETLAGDNIYLPKGFVCDACNNGISSQLDEALINFEPIAFLRVQFTPYTKTGKFPKANFQNMVLEKTNPNHIKITAKDKTARPKNKRTLEDGQEAFNLTWTGKKLTWQLYARAIYKFALGFVAHDMGHAAALDERYQPARDFILGRASFNNNMVVSTKSKPHPEIRTHCDMNYGGTPFFIDIFGMIFMINLEESPVLQNPAKRADEPEDEILEPISKEYEFELISLN
jgi:hypothetical protein